MDNKAVAVPAEHPVAEPVHPVHRLALAVLWVEVAETSRLDPRVDARDVPLVDLAESVAVAACLIWLPVQDVTRTPLTYLTEAQASRVRALEELVA